MAEHHVILVTSSCRERAIDRDDRSGFANFVPRSGRQPIERRACANNYRGVRINFYALAHIIGGMRLVRKRYFIYLTMIAQNSSVLGAANTSNFDYL